MFLSPASLWGFQLTVLVSLVPVLGGMYGSKSSFRYASTEINATSSLPQSCVPLLGRVVLERSSTSPASPPVAINPEAPPPPRLPPVP